MNVRARAKVRPVRIELTTLGLWDLRAASCAIAAWHSLAFALAFTLPATEIGNRNANAGDVATLKKMLRNKRFRSPAHWQG